jgi:hypothetical protein
VFVYEGPCGFWIYRDHGAGDAAGVAGAHPRRAGDHVKTDRRSERLASLARAGNWRRFTPDIRDEAIGIWCAGATMR